MSDTEPEISVTRMRDEISGSVIRDNADESRWEISLDGERVGLITYSIDDGVITYRHAETDPEYGGRGLASTLTRAALDDARARGLRIRPRCPFVVDFVARHQAEYGDLVAVA